MRELGTRRSNIVAFELDPARAEKLRQAGVAEVHCRDFLTYSPNGRFERVMMNPPFTTPGNSFAYIAHIQHAYSLLSPNGILAAIAPASLRFRTDKKTAALRELIERSGRICDLPENAFRESGTDVNTVLLKLER